MSRCPMCFLSLAHRQREIYDTSDWRLGRHDDSGIGMDSYSLESLCGTMSKHMWGAEQGSQRREYSGN
jgi:hypothetical protein